MIRRTNIELQKLTRVRFFDCLSSCFVILVVSLLFYLVPAISPMYTAILHQAQAQTSTTAATKIRVNSFLIYDNNSTLGIKIQYPVNWEKDSYDKKVAFFAPPLEGDKRKLIPAGLIVKVDNLPFQITSLEDYISQYVSNLRKHAEISEPIGVSLTALAGNLADNVTYSAKIGQSEYRATDIIMLSGIKKYEITYYISEAEKPSSYLPTIYRMIDSFEIRIDISNSATNGTTRNNSFLTYENNSTLGIKIQYPVNWERLEYDDEGVLFLSPSESNSDKFLESFSIRVTPSNNTSLSELAKESIDNYGQQFIHFQLIGSKAITFYGKSAYLLNYTFTDKLYGKGMGVDIGTTTGNKAYVLTYFAEPAKFSNYLPIIKTMIESFVIQNRNELRQPSYLDLV
jgi:hypothetical protein